MPTYDYVCAACGHALEIFHSMTEPAKKKCPKCGKSKLERRIGAGAGFLFKGQGFYKTDYRSDSYKAGAKADSEASSTPEAPASSDDKAVVKTPEKSPKSAANANPAAKAETKSKPKD